MIEFFIKYSAQLIAIIYALLFLAHLYVFNKLGRKNKYTIARGFMLLMVSFFYSAVWLDAIEISQYVSAQIARLIWLTFALFFVAELIEDTHKYG